MARRPAVSEPHSERRAIRNSGNLSWVGEHLAPQTSVARAPSSPAFRDTSRRRSIVTRVRLQPSADADARRFQNFREDRPQTVALAWAPGRPFSRSRECGYETPVEFGHWVIVLLSAVHTTT